MRFKRRTEARKAEQPGQPAAPKAALLDRAGLAIELCRIARRAGAVIMAIYNTGFEVRAKPDASPVSDADERAEALILAALAGCAGDISVVAEERVAAGTIPDISCGRFFLVDPLDGTREFIVHNGEFTVNIALIENGLPTVGVVHVPALGETYWTAGDGKAWRQWSNEAPSPIACRPMPRDGLVVVASRSHRDPQTTEYLEGLLVKEVIAVGSSLKFCRIAEGVADIYPRFGQTSEWDTAAGHAVLVAAGGSVLKLNGEPLTYGKPAFRNLGFVARGRAPSAA